MDIKQVNSAIMFGDFTNVELNSIIDAIKFRRASMQKAARHSLHLGDTVKFTSSKTGRLVQGTVNKIAQKYATVNTPQGLWRVPMNMLETVA